MQAPPHLQRAYQRGCVQAVNGDECLNILAQRRFAAGQLAALKRLHNRLMIAAPVEVPQKVGLQQRTSAQRSLGARQLFQDIRNILVLLHKKIYIQKEQTCAAVFSSPDKHPATVEKQAVMKSKLACCQERLASTLFHIACGSC